MYTDSVSYTGCAQSGQPNANNAGRNPSATSLTVSVTTTVDNCWLIGYYDSSDQSQTVGTNTFFRSGVNGFLGFIDSNGAQTPPGSKSMQITSAVNSEQLMVIAAISPYSTPSSGMMSFFMA